MADATSEIPPPPMEDNRTTTNDPIPGSHSEDEASKREEAHDIDNETTVSPVNSQDVTISEESTAIDGTKVACAKRKRTSPEDQAILEAEYKANPKPDKAARLDIVKRVSLSEKAVQIWFQNRRQNTRRKSRPLLPHEIAAFGLGGMAALSFDPTASYGAASSSSFGTSSSQPEPLVIPENGNAAYQQLKSAAMKAPSSSAPVAVMTTPQSAHSSDQESGRVGLPSFSKSFPSAMSQEFPRTLTDKSSSQPILPLPITTPGYLANRRSASSSYFASPSTAIMHPPFITPLVQSRDSLHPKSAPAGVFTPLGQPQDSASQVHLSYSADGKASLVSSTNIISPPKPPTTKPLSTIEPIPFPSRRLTSLQRSHSALPFHSIPSRVDAPTGVPSVMPSTALPSQPHTPRLFSGRSKDARAWEFCCDTEARDELTQQAENESHGSAVAAISLLRSTSGSALKVNHNKRNAPPISLYRSGHNTQFKRPKMGRAQSSLARMQGAVGLSTQSDNANLNSMKPKPVAEGSRSPSDSDKENWVPVEGGGHRRLPMPGGTNHPDNQVKRRRVLEEPGASSPMKDGSGRRRGDGTVAPKELAADVASFMAAPVSPSKKGDLDCIQGLLSLSQGNWR